MTDSIIKTSQLPRYVRVESSGGDSADSPAHAALAVAAHFEPASQEQATGETSAEGLDVPDTLQTALAHVTKQLQQLNTDRETVQREVQPFATAIAIAIAESILHREIHDGGQAIEQLVQGILAECGGKSPVAIYLHPEDADRVDPNSVPCEIKADTNIPRGNCRADLEEFWIVSDWQQRLEAMKQGLTGGVHDA